jgi:hexulose-6-phosphate isomerase
MVLSDIFTFRFGGCKAQHALTGWPALRFLIIHMKKSISIWSFPGDWDFERRLSAAKEAGFEGFEPEFAESGAIHPGSAPSQLAAVKMLAENYSLTLSGLATGLYWGSNPASGDSTVRQRAADILNRQIECAAALGIDTVLVVPGAVGVDFIPGAEEVPYDIAYERAQAFIQGALPAAKRHGVCLGIENVWNKFLLSPLEMRDFIDSFQSEWVGSYFDVGNALATGYPEHWIRILGDRIKRVHFKDYRRAVGSVAGFVDLLSGDVRWPAVMRELRATGYSGWVAAEMIPPVPFYKYAPEVLIQNTARAMDAIFSLQR